MIIYEPKGKAREYSPLACNLYKGCSHACSYCYAPSATFTPREKFISEIKPRPNVIQQLEKDCKTFSGNKNEILLSFTSDAYQPCEEKFKITRQAIKLLVDHDLTPVVLTKGGQVATRDFDLLKLNKRSRFAVTLTTDEVEESALWEPCAALPEIRINNLVKAKDSGIGTWVSFEPVFNPGAVLRLIDATHDFVDFYKVGKLNYHPLAKYINWVSFLHDVEERLNHYNKPFLIKKDLEAYRHKTAT